MSWSFSIGHLFGSELRVHGTFLLLLAWIGTAAWLAEGPAAAFVNMAFVLALFACVVAHEFGHALMARRYGIKTPDITLLPIGGMARLERIPEDPGQEVAVAVAGPAVNVVIWAVLTFVFGVDAHIGALFAIEDMGQGFFERLAAVNLFLVLFNMIPAFPMDGGRVFRALLSIPLGRPRATRIAALAGQGVAFLFGYLGLMSGNLILLLIAIFIFMAALAESSDVALHDLAKGYLARDAMITSFESLAPGAAFEVAEQALLRTTQAEFPVLSPDGTLAGILTKAAILGRGDRRGATVSAAMVTGIPAVKLTDPLEAVLDDLQQPETPAVAVTDRAGHFVGYVTRENIGEWAVLRHGARQG
jgi:Zn-dependent protease/CBS domain-containing protein